MTGRGFAKWVSTVLVLGATTSVASAAETSSVPPAPQPPKPIRSEIVNYDNWRLVCEEYAEPAKKTVCVGILQIAKKETGETLFTWNLGLGADGAPVSTFVTLTGVSVAQGVELRVGSTPVRKVGFATCEPTQCVARAPIDAALRKDLIEADKAEITIHGSTGRNMKLELALKGVDGVLAAIK
jgi:invasion protein IalB